MIPEPSEDEIEMVMYLLKDPPENHSAFLCIIAHLIRNGAVLAEFAKWTGQDHRKDLEAAIALFEKLKEVCGE